MKKDIYIIKNSVNDKVYIGQAKNAAERWMSHIYNAKYEQATSKDKQMIHKAMCKYGFDKFHYEILEHQIENYDDREKYWIHMYDSIAPNGYNVSVGGSGIGYGANHPSSIFKDEDTLMKCISEISSSTKSFENIGRKYGCCQEVISAINSGARYHMDNLVYPLRRTRYQDWLIKQVRYSIKYELDMSFEDIAEKYDIDKSQISLINQGKIYHINSEDYPLRKKRRQDLSDEVVDAIISDITESSLSLGEIAVKYDVSRMRVSGINTGKFYKRDIIYPIRKDGDPRNKSYKRFLDKDIIVEIHNLLSNSDLSCAKIAEKYGLTTTTIHNINNGKCKTYIMDGVKYPIRNMK